MNPIRLRCQFDDPNCIGFWTREITFPFPPFPGLIIGPGLVVEEVLVCQGDYDGKGPVSETAEVRLKTPGDTRYLESHGWRNVSE